MAEEPRFPVLSGQANIRLRDWQARLSRRVPLSNLYGLYAEQCARPLFQDFFK
jgi:hypothetical protein